MLTVVYQSNGRPVCAGALLLACLFFSGCSDNQKVRSYTIPSGPEPMTTDRLQSFYAARGPRTSQLPELKVPESWRKAAADQFSAAAWSAGPEDRPVRITVTQTPAAMGLLAQLNRWRNQIGLDPLTAETLSDVITPIRMGDIEAVFVHFKGTGDESIAGAVAETGGSMWFFKMRGPSKTVEEELEHMRQFCESARFDSN